MIEIHHNENNAYLKVLFERDQGFTMKGNEIGYISPGSWQANYIINPNHLIQDCITRIISFVF